MQRNSQAMCGYIIPWFSGIGLLITGHRDEFLRFHAFQSIFFSLAVSIIGIISLMIFILLTFFSIGFAKIIYYLVILLVIISMWAWLTLMFKAYKGEKYKLPIIGNWAERI